MGIPKLTAPVAQEIDVTQIQLHERLRPISLPHATMLAESIKETGLRQPIEVRPRKSGGFRVVAGGHRFYAVAEILKLPTIVAFVRNLNDTEARIAEIDENLVRHELNPLDRAVFLAERKALYERLHPETVRGKAGAEARHHATEIVSFARDVAERVGLGERMIRKAVAIATGLTEESREAIAGTHLSHKQSDLIALAKLPAAQQKRVIAGLLADEPKWASVREAIDTIAGRTKKPVDGYARLLSAWRHATAAERRQFRAYIDSPEVVRAARAA
jgi:ParB family chromosome partitioning protein